VLLGLETCLRDGQHPREIAAQERAGIERKAGENAASQNTLGVGHNRHVFVA
jgi:hypothetical protein